MTRRTDYERIARDYDVHRDQWDIPRDEVLRSLVEERPNGVIMLDVGCGTGRYMTQQQQHMLSLPVRWIGIDPSPAMLQQAVRKEGHAIYLRGVVEQLPFADESVDYVHSSYTFHHFVDKHRALDEMRRVLCPGGCIRIVNVEPWSMESWWVYEFFEGTAETDRTRFWPVPTIVNELERRGLRTEASVERSQRTLHLAEVLAEAESRTISQLDVLDDGDYERGLANLREAIGGSTDGTMVRTSASVRITARR